MENLELISKENEKLKAHIELLEGKLIKYDPALWKNFMVAENDQKLIISFKNENGIYVRGMNVNSDKNNTLHETFRWEIIFTGKGEESDGPTEGNDYIFLKDINGNYLSCEENGIINSESQAYHWQKWKYEFRSFVGLNGKTHICLCLKSYFGNYLSVDAINMYATRRDAGQWEKFFSWKDNDITLIINTIN